MTANHRSVWQSYEKMNEVHCFFVTSTNGKFYEAPHHHVVEPDIGALSTPDIAATFTNGVLDDTATFSASSEINVSKNIFPFPSDDLLNAINPYTTTKMRVVSLNLKITPATKQVEITINAAMAFSINLNSDKQFRPEWQCRHCFDKH